MGTDSDVFFVSLGDVFDAYGTPLMTSHDGRSLEYQLPLIHVHQCGTLTQFRSLNLIWIAQRPMYTICF